MAVPTWTLTPGDTISRKALHVTYGGKTQGGISPSRTSPNVFVFTDLLVGAHHGYIYDRWDPNRPGGFHYTGEGQRGNQRLSHGNRAILKHATDGRALRVFQGVRGEVRYLGEFKLTDPPYTFEPAHESGGATIRQVVVFNLQAMSLAADMTPSPPAAGPRYRRARFTPTKAPPAPWTRDPNVLDRSLKAHIDTQNALEAAMSNAGASTWSPGPGEPDFDLAWKRRKVVYVAEVKSLPDIGTEDRQLRLGIGQVLDYQALMARRYPRVRAVLAVERQPSDPRWQVLCESHSVTLVWPETFGILIRR